MRSARQRNNYALRKKRVQWQSSNNDFPFFGSKKWKIIRCLFVTVCRASSLFLLRTRCPLKLEAKLEIRLIANEETAQAHMDGQRCSTRRIPSSTNSFRNFASRPRVLNSKNSTSKARNEIASSQSSLRFFKFDLKQIAMRKRVLKDCDNLPGPIYL